MDTLTIVLLTVAIALLAGAISWYGPRRRHWQTHVRDESRPQGGHDRSLDDSPDDGERP